MKAVAVGFFMLFAVTVGAAQDSTKLLNDGVIVAGVLNPGFHGRAATIEAKVLEIKTSPDHTQLLKLALPQQEVKPIWATTFVPIAKDEIKIGDTLLFKGYIAATNSMDPSGKLRVLVEGSAAVLRARTIETPK
jgi:hypothetical protein